MRGKVAEDMYDLHPKERKSMPTAELPIEPFARNNTLATIDQPQTYWTRSHIFQGKSLKEEIF